MLKPINRRRGGGGGVLWETVTYDSTKKTITTQWQDTWFGHGSTNPAYLVLAALGSLWVIPRAGGHRAWSVAYRAEGEEWPCDRVLWMPRLCLALEPCHAHKLSTISDKQNGKPPPLPTTIPPLHCLLWTEMSYEWNKKPSMQTETGRRPSRNRTNVQQLHLNPSLKFLRENPT